MNTEKLCPHFRDDTLVYKPTFHTSKMQKPSTGNCSSTNLDSFTTKNTTANKNCDFKTVSAKKHGHTVDM